MNIKISKVLESVVARTVFDLSREGVCNALKDRLMVALLQDDASMACRMLSLRMPEQAIAALHDRIVGDIAGMPDDGDGEAAAPQEFFEGYVSVLREKFPTARNISTAHAMLDILEDTTTVSSRAFAEAGLSFDTLVSDMEKFADTGALKAQVEIRMLDAVDEPPPQSELLARFGVDLTRMAREGRLDPVVGREREIGRVVQILSRRKKNNPVLVGEAGVGKSAIVEGVAQLLVSGNAPYTVADKRIFALDMASLVAGTKFRGEFEERMQQLLQELRKAKDTIVFIDEIHTIVGAGSSQGSLDTANILKPALARGELQTIGATTLDEFRDCIESDAALERRFQRVTVEPSTAAETLAILKNLAPRYEAHHNVRYSEEALQACVDLSARYITDRHFPDKAVDLLDEAGSQARLADGGKPEALLKMERMLSDAREHHRQALAEALYDRAVSARLQLIAIRSRLDEYRSSWLRSLRMNPVTVTADDVAKVVTALSGVPAERLGADETERLRGLEAHLRAHVIGQEEAVSRVAGAIRRSRAGFRDADRPAGVFMFVGATGVGKTLLAKQLSAWLFGERQGLVRLDMSEYGERHSVARLVGSPPGYVGYGEGGQLSEAVRRCPWSVVLLDEIEKAHPEVFNTLLQIFDEGRLTDGSGRMVDFRNTIIIMTSNVGSREIAARAPQVGFATLSKSDNGASANEEGYRKALERCFAPEFLNRIDDVVLFRALDSGDIGRIVTLELDSLSERVAKLGYRLSVTPEACSALAELGFDAHYGARALRRMIVERVEQPLANLVVDGCLREGDTVVVECTDNGLALRTGECCKSA